MKVAFQGVKGAYSELAATQFFGKKVESVPCLEFADVFKTVTKGKTEFGIIPIENALTGSIHQNFDLLLRHKLWICGETKLRIIHSLLAHPKASLKTIKKVYSHPQALWQCQRYIKSQVGMEEVAYFDTAGSARFVGSEKNLELSAIASKSAAAHYGLKVIKEGIEDDKQNFTRFFVLTATHPKPSKVANKTSIVFGLRDLPGALFRALEVFASRNLQIFKIESRPIPGRPWEYLFYVDFGSNGVSKAYEEAINALEDLTTRLRLLGSYKMG